MSKDSDNKEKEKKKQEAGDDLRIFVLNLLPEVSTLTSLVTIRLV